jgi:hypothetical protein
VKNYRFKRISSDLWEVWAVNMVGTCGSPARLETRLAGVAGADIIATYEAFTDRDSDVFMYGVLMGIDAQRTLSKDGTCLSMKT